ncbi:hypothetical protein [Mucilaginibacter xinganensis]|uniref:Lipoprotein n=1 Tax=Mucilaginibacter xinganensis TaxID=1234841 RepID=A0A223P3H7_9SPHI|nr:hypothetical protein [Mucilaginibacter xinganensis]ASU36665.1 hypothetical protein MuYL_4782 [Mucilaginibacter xinganensis]
MKKRIIKYALLTALSGSLYSCGQHSGSENTANETAVPAGEDAVDTSKIVPADKLIVPGKSAGKIVLNGSADSLVSVFGKPDFSDAGMGSVVITWYAKHDTSGYKISIFAGHNFGAKDESVAHIRKVLVTSPDFKTAEGLNTGLDLTKYQEHYKLKQISSYTDKGKKVKVYEATGKGIAFEVDSLSNKGVAIVVHQPNDSRATYINMH